MKFSSGTGFAYVFIVFVLLILVLGRYTAGGFDFSYFFVGGTDFVDTSKTPLPVVVQHGQGYDGQFFFRYALNPFEFSKIAHGVTVDLVPYRMQRIGYPLITWIFSFGGRPFLVPFALLLVNMLSFVGIFFFTQKFIKMVKGLQEHIYLPLFLCGLYMSVARDLAEVMELFFFLGAMYFYFKSSFMKFAFFASITILCRETSLIAFVPMIIYSLFNSVSYIAKKITIVWLFVPVFVFVFWKWCISLNLEPGPLVPGSGNIGVPFLGMILGFKGNFDISTNKNILQLGFWILYFVWQIWLTIQVVSSLKNSLHSNKHFILPLAIIYLTWMLFAVFLSSAIYVDDWSFVRVFSLWGMVGFLILITNKQSVAKSFNLYSVLLVGLTIIRLIIKV